MKCKRCGKLVGVTRRGQAIADGVVCYACLDELGFRKSDRTIKPWLYEYWEIQDGPMRIKYNQAARKAKHEDWMRAHPEFQAVIDVLNEDEDFSPSDDENDEISEDTDIDQAE